MPGHEPKTMLLSLLRFALRQRVRLGPRAGQQVAELGQADIDPGVVNLGIRTRRVPFAGTGTLNGSRGVVVVESKAFWRP